jgi:hypothetical protein
LLLEGSGGSEEGDFTPLCAHLSKYSAKMLRMYQLPEQNSFGSLNVTTDRALSRATVDGHSHANGATLTTLGGTIR